jgi:hypothetical protein
VRLHINQLASRYSESGAILSLFISRLSVAPKERALAFLGVEHHACPLFYHWSSTWGSAGQLEMWKGPVDFERVKDAGDRSAK